MARVFLFGRLADQAGWREREIEVADLSILRVSFSQVDPVLGEALAGLGVQVAVDKTIVCGEAALSAASEVAFLPPMSGG